MVFIIFCLPLTLDVQLVDVTHLLNCHHLPVFTLFISQTEQMTCKYDLYLFCQKSHEMQIEMDTQQKG